MKVAHAPPESQNRLKRAYVEIAKVIQLYRSDHWPVTWQDLADRLRDIGDNSACRSHRSDNRRPRAWSTLRSLPPRSVGPFHEVGPDVPQGCAEQQGQAADRRVGKQRDPGRQGKCESRTHRQDPHSGRQRNKSSKHFLQPLREACNQDARYAWQEYGQALVKLRRMVETPTLTKGF